MFLTTSEPKIELMCISSSSLSMQCQWGNNKESETLHNSFIFYSLYVQSLTNCSCIGSMGPVSWSTSMSFNTALAQASLSAYLVGPQSGSGKVADLILWGTLLLTMEMNSRIFKNLPQSNHLLANTAICIPYKMVCTWWRKNTYTIQG